MHFQCKIHFLLSINSNINPDTNFNAIYNPNVKLIMLLFSPISSDWYTTHTIKYSYQLL